MQFLNNYIATINLKDSKVILFNEQDSLVTKQRTLRSEARVQNRKHIKDMTNNACPTQELLSKRIEFSQEQYESLSKKIK